MKTLLLKLLITLFVLFGLISCSDYLNVKPEDKFLESQVYSTEAGINNALNGIYLEIAKPKLYGQNMTMGTLDFMAQYYNISDSRNPQSVFANYNYNDGSAQSTFENIWTNAYTSILDINKFTVNMEQYPMAITETKADMLRGEALGLRAMLHFDMLRLFGPIYGNNPSNQTIPYYTKAEAQANDILPANKVIEKVLDDLQKAEELLLDDPVRENGVQTSLEGTQDDFYRFRNRRMNYYAVKALEARVQLYAGNNSEAQAAATTVINDAKEWFPWTEPGEIISAGSYQDRVFSSEIIFGIENQDMYEQQQNLFSGDLRPESIIAPLPSRLESTYEANENDYRYNPWWKIPTTGGKTIRTFFKYADVPGSPWRFFQSLIRISEMYYIAAETEPSAEKALEYLNTVRFNRGLQDLPLTADLTTEIEKEYKKEFYGEGQLFFYYKRNNVGRIQNGSSPYYTVAPEYVVPLPDSETEYRN